MNYEKQRAEIARRYNQELKELKKENRALNEANTKLCAEKEELEDKIRVQQEWIERLLEFTEISTDDLKKVIEKDKNIGNAAEAVARLFSNFPFGNF